MKATLFTFSLVLAITFSANAQYAGGSGTEEDPYQIVTADHLNAVRDNLGSHFIMMNDIDLAAAGYTIWLPIGRSADNAEWTAFSGVFDGGGYAIFNLNIIMSDLNYGGLFTVVSGKICNLAVKNGSLTASGVGMSGYGLIAGYLGQSGLPGEISNCYAEGTVSSSCTAGTAGVALVLGALTNASTVTGCYSKGVVAAPEQNYVGGLVGRLMHNSCSMFDCYSEAVVTGAINVGGIVGRIYSDQAGNINAGFLYATGKVIGSNWVGGIAGDFYNVNAAGMIAANPSITATSANGNVARIAPNANGTPMLEYMYGLSTTEVKLGATTHNIVSDDTGVDGKTIASGELTEEFFDEAGWDLEMTWSVEGESGLPMLQWQHGMPNNIQKVQAEVPFTVYMQGKMLHIANIEPNSTISLYNLSGQLLKAQTCTGTSDVIILTQPGLYMVKVAGKAAKVICE